jgi:MFS family permease
MSTPNPGSAGHTAQNDPTLGALVHDLTEQVPQLIRSEIRLAQAEMTEKGKRAGLGIGMFSAAGLLGFFGLACVVATAILGLAHALPDWLSALIVAAVLFVVAGVVALVGKKEVQQSTPPMPEHAIEGVKEDIAVVKGEHR